MGDLCNLQQHWLRAMGHPSRELELSGWADRTMGLDAPEGTATILPFVRMAAGKTTRYIPVTLAPTNPSRALVLTPADRAAHDDWKI